MLTKVTAAIAGKALFSPGEVVVTAVSGGADSVALLDALVCQQCVPVRIVVAHLHHGLRGAEADADESFVRTLAEKYHLPFASKRVHVAHRAKQLRMSVEEAGRHARYSFFNEVAAAHGARVIALAHHMNDQAETVLMRLLRGAAGSGLSAMQMKSADGRYVRPLLAVTRDEIEQYLAERGFEYRTDSSNSDTRYLRNRIRHELIPALTTYNPQVVARLVSTASALAEDETVLSEVTDRLFHRLALQTEQAVAMPIPAIVSEPPGLRLRLYRRIIRHVQGDLYRISSRNLEDVDTLVASATSQADLMLPCGLLFQKRYGQLFCRRHLLAPVAPCHVQVNGPGDYPLSSGRVLRVTLADGNSAPVDGIRSIIMDLEKAPFPWIVRSMEPGDRLAPIGMSGTKKVKDLFIDLKVPREVRQVTPLVWSSGKLLWVCCFRQTREALVSPTTRVRVQAEILDITH